jgi:hypothetical protein
MGYTCFPEVPRSNSGKSIDCTKKLSWFPIFQTYISKSHNLLFSNKVLTFVNLARELSQLPVVFLFRFFPTLRYVNGNLISKFIEWNILFVSHESTRFIERVTVAITFYKCIRKFLGTSLSRNISHCNSSFLWLPSVPWEAFQESISIRSHRASLHILLQFCISWLDTECEILTELLKSQKPLHIWHSHKFPITLWS